MQQLSVCYPVLLGLYIYSPFSQIIEHSPKVDWANLREYTGVEVLKVISKDRPESLIRNLVLLVLPYLEQKVVRKVLCGCYVYIDSVFLTYLFRCLVRRG